MGAPAYLEQVVRGDNKGTVSWLIRALLWPFSLLYRAGLAVFLGIYTLGIRKRYGLSVPVISIGNLTFGGTGKTPAVQTICRMLLEQGKRVVVLSRGHGGTARGTLIVSDGSDILCDSGESGDEPTLLAKSLPGVPVVVGRDRRDSGRIACERFSPDVIVLDDGLQYWQLHRELDIVVLDVAQPFGSGFVMPMGDLREPIGGLHRAGVVLLSNSGAMSAKNYAGVCKQVSRLAPRALVLRCAHEPTSFRRADDSQQLPLHWVRKRRVLAFCGIGRPASFFEMLEALDAVMDESIAFPDHHKYSDDDIALIENERASRGAEAVITTEKDLARLGDSVPIRDLYALGIKFEIEEHERLAEYLSDRINTTH